MFPAPQAPSLFTDARAESRYEAIYNRSLYRQLLWCHFRMPLTQHIRLQSLFPPDGFSRDWLGCSCANGFWLPLFKARNESAKKRKEKKKTGFPTSSTRMHLCSRPFVLRASLPTFMVSSIDRNFLLSPISMALLMSGTASLTASSMGMGGMFSPPAVMISSEKTHTQGKDLKRRYSWVAESIVKDSLILCLTQAWANYGPFSFLIQPTNFEEIVLTVSE